MLVPRDPGHALAAIGLVLLTLAIGGCAYSLGAYQLVDGSEFSVEQTLEGLEAGMQPSEVEDLLGEPWNTDQRGSDQEWLYFAEYVHRACDVYLFGLIKVKGRPRDVYRARLVFGNDGLKEVSILVKEPPDRKETLALLDDDR